MPSVPQRGKGEEKLEEQHGKEHGSEVNSILSGTPLTAAHQAPQCMEFSRQEYWSGLPFPSPGDLPNPGIDGRLVLGRLFHLGDAVAPVALQLADLGAQHLLLVHVLKQVVELLARHELVERPQLEPQLLLLLGDKFIKEVNYELYRCKTALCGIWYRYR